MAVLDCFNLSGKTAVVTGSAGLLGQQWQSVLKEAGAEVIDFDIKDGRDITSEGSVSTWADIISADILINNAGGEPYNPKGI